MSNQQQLIQISAPTQDSQQFSPTSQIFTPTQESQLCTLTQNEPEPLRIPEPVKTLCFFDTETTGLTSSVLPPRIFQIAIHTLETRHFLRLEDVYRNNQHENFVNYYKPRVYNSLELCFQPQAMIPPGVEDITLFNNELLEFQPKWTPDTETQLKLFLNRLEKPIAVIGHNSIKHDFPILKSELQNADTDSNINFLAIDSLPILRQIFGDLNPSMAPHPPPLYHPWDRYVHEEPIQGQIGINLTMPPSFSLPRLYNHIFNVNPPSSHQASQDVWNLIKVCGAVGTKFVECLNKDETMFQDAIIKRIW